MSADATAAQSADPAPTFRLWKKMQELPLGNWLFSHAVCFKAPYFRTVRPLIRELYADCEIVERERWRGINNAARKRYVELLIRPKE